MVWGQLIICYTEAGLKSRRTKTVLEKKEGVGNHHTILRAGHTARRLGTVMWTESAGASASDPGDVWGGPPPRAALILYQRRDKVSPDGLIYLLLLSAPTCLWAQWCWGWNASFLLFSPAFVLLGDGDRRWVLLRCVGGWIFSRGMQRLVQCREMIRYFTEPDTCRGCRPDNNKPPGKHYT